MILEAEQLSALYFICHHIDFPCKKTKDSSLLVRKKSNKRYMYLDAYRIYQQAPTLRDQR